MKNILKKRGQTNILAGILLVVIVIVAGVIIFNITRSIISEKSDRIETEINSINKILFGQVYVPQGVIAYYKFDGNANDETGNHNGSMIVPSFINDSERGEVVNFSGGLGNSILVGAGWLPTGNMAISVWVYAKSWGGENNGRIIVSKNGQRFYLDGNGNTRLTFSANDGANKAYSNENMALNQWKHIVVNRIGTETYFYIDGVKSQGNSISAGAPLAGTNVLIGSSPSYDKNFEGYMDDLIVFDRYLSESEIQSLFKPVPLIEFNPPTPPTGNLNNSQTVRVNVSATDPGLKNNLSLFLNFNNSLVSWWRMDDLSVFGLPSDYIGQNNFSQAFGQAAQTSRGYFGKGFIFDGAGDSIYSSSSGTLNLSLFNSLSISAWVKPRNISPSNYQYIYLQGGNNLAIRQDGIVLFYLKGVKNWVTNDGVFNLFDGNWHLITATYNNSQQRLFIDGQLVQSTLASGIINGSSNFYVGYNFNGTIDDVIIFKKALSANEIATLYANSPVKYLYNEFVNLTNDIYTVRAYAQDTAGGINSTELREISLNVETGVSSCRTLDRANTIYKLTQDLSGAEVTANCININAPGIIFDCQGHSINGGQVINRTVRIENGSGDYINYTYEEYVAGNLTLIYNRWQNNNLIKNCNLESGSFGITSYGNNNQFLNNTFKSFISYGIRSQGNKNLIEKNYFENSEKAIAVEDGNYNIVRNNIVRNSRWGLSCWRANSNQFLNNEISGNDYGIVLYDASNTFFECSKITNNPTQDIYVYAVPWYSWVSGTHNDNITAKSLVYNTKFIGSGASWNESIGDCSKYLSDSNLPFVLIDSFGIDIPNEPKTPANLITIYNNLGKRNYLTDPFNYNGYVGIELRGQSSQWPEFLKKTYLFETREWDGNNFTDIDVSLMGYPSEEDWILKGDWFDRTLLRNVLTYNLSNEMGRYASRTKPVEVFKKNYTTGNFVYDGISTFMEQVKRGPDRVNISKLNPDERSGENVTGGYILSIDKNDYKVAVVPTDYFYTPNRNISGGIVNIPANDSDILNSPLNGTIVYFGTRYLYNYPDTEAIVQEQKDYIKNYLTEFEGVLAGPNFADPVNGYAKYIDVDSFIDFLILVEFAKNSDSLKTSTYLYKDKNGKVNMGPVWDYDLAYGNMAYWGGADIFGWQYQWSTSPSDYRKIPFWWKRLMQDPAFKQRFQNRWFELRNTTLSLTHVFNIIDSKASEINEAQQRHFLYWNTLNKENTCHTACGSVILSWSSFPTGINTNDVTSSCTLTPTPKNTTLCPNYWQGEIQLMKEYITARTNWIDNNIMNL